MKTTADPFAARWRRFWRLSSAERAMVVQAMMLLPLTGLGLRVVGFRRWKKWLERFSTPSRTRTAGDSLEHVLERGSKIARVVRSAELHGLGRQNCLQRSIVLWWLLRREGIGSELHIGARKEQGKFLAHAWVELNGQVLNDTADVHQHYARFDAPLAASEADFR